MRLECKSSLHEEMVNLDGFGDGLIWQCVCLAYFVGLVIDFGMSLWRDAVRVVLFAYV